VLGGESENNTKNGGLLNRKARLSANSTVDKERAMRRLDIPESANVGPLEVLSSGGDGL